jgi:hypothetical protein
VRKKTKTGPTWRALRRQRPGQTLVHSPGQDIQFSLKQPVIRVPRQTCANRIVEDVLPFRIIILRTPQLRVPEIALPNRLFMCTWPISGGNTFPEADPLHQGLSGKHSRGTEKVNMIRHYDVAADAPRFALLPCPEKHCDRIRMREDERAILATNSQKNNDRLIKPFANWRVHRVFAAHFHYFDDAPTSFMFRAPTARTPSKQITDSALPRPRVARLRTPRWSGRRLPHR